MPVRQATPEETQAFFGNKAVIFATKQPNSSKKNSEENTALDLQNLDFDPAQAAGSYSESYNPEQ